MSPRPRSDRKFSKPQKRTRRNAIGIASRSRKAANNHVSQIFIYSPLSLRHSQLTVAIDQDVLHLDSPLTDPDLASPRPIPRLDHSSIAATNSLGGVQRNSAWFKPIHKSSDHPSAAHNYTSPNDTKASVPAPSDTIEPVRTTRLGKGRARKEDKQGELVWPEHIEAAFIEGQSIPPALDTISYSLIADPAFSLGLRLFHCTSSEDLHPCHTRNFGRNKKVRQFIEQKTGVERTTRQISSRIQVLRSLWRGTPGTRVPPFPLSLLPQYPYYSPTFSWPQI